MTSITNPWSGICRTLAVRDKRAAPQTTLKQKDGTLTTNLQEPIQNMLQVLPPEDNQEGRYGIAEKHPHTSAKRQRHGRRQGVYCTGS